MKKLDEKTKYFTYGIIGGFVIVFIVFLVSFIIPFTVLEDNIAVIPITGEVSYINDSNNTVPSEFKILFDKALNDNSVKAIVLEINSAGGSLLASEEISSYVSNSSKPVVSWISVSSSTYSYLIASSSDKIVANENSIIGTNGFNYLNADLKDYYSRISINPNTSKGNTFNTIYPSFNSLSNSQKISINNMLNIDSKYFIEQVKNNRHINHSLVNFNNGKIYSGVTGINNGLVDYIGSESKAFEIAANISNITNYSVIRVNTDGFFDEFIELISK